MNEARPDAADRDHRHGSHAAGGHGAAATDPVCGMTVDPQTSKHRFDYRGQAFHFCCTGCREKFAADPEKYLTHAEAPPVPAGAIWTCPMHPEVRQDHPGSCPICGMALEPILPTAETGESPELRDMRRRFWGALALSIPVVVLAMGGYVPVMGPAIDRLISRGLSDWIQFGLTTPVVLWTGSFFCPRGGLSRGNRCLNMFWLTALGVGTAYVYCPAA